MIRIHVIINMILGTVIVLSENSFYKEPLVKSKIYLYGKKI